MRLEEVKGLPIYGDTIYKLFPECSTYVEKGILYPFSENEKIGGKCFNLVTYGYLPLGDNYFIPFRISDSCFYLNWRSRRLFKKANLARYESMLLYKLSELDDRIKLLEEKYLKTAKYYIDNFKLPESFNEDDDITIYKLIK